MILLCVPTSTYYFEDFYDKHVSVVLNVYIKNVNICMPVHGETCKIIILLIRPYCTMFSSK